ncbi:MAG: 2-C-methyl-D-erythritol 4-phosphate cytidylyltransferase [Armatimonadetes bacterium]|nr:2-C-methyl-D-erythritol 4-phosphate cytidylyltransferase [Armatimonadota bacterium]
MTRVLALVLGAGRSRRMGDCVNKMLLTAGGRTVLEWSVAVFERCPLVARIYVTASAEDVSQYRSLLGAFSKVAAVIEGGAERQESVYRALRQMRAAESENPLVAVHDGARPMLADATLVRLLHEAERAGGAILAVPAKETMKRVQDDIIVETVPRESLMAAQTPQVFSLDVLLEAHKRASEAGFVATDDAMLIERMGGVVRVVAGDYDNLKITTPEDLVALRAVHGR